MVLFEIFLRRNLIQIYTKNAPNCTILKNFLGGACPRTSLANSWPPSQILATPLYTISGPRLYVLLIV